MNNIFFTLKPCTCSKCAETEEEDPDNNLSISEDHQAGTSSSSAKKRRKSLKSPENRLSLLERMQSNFLRRNNSEEETDEDKVDSPSTPSTSSGPKTPSVAEEDQESLLPFQCGVSRCEKRFAGLDDLTGHVAKDHPEVKASEDGKEELDEFPEDPSEDEDDEEVVGEIIKPDADDNGPIVPKESKTLGPDGCERNWAAEFGYGKTSSLGKAKAGDLLSRMKMKFKGVNAEEEEVEKDKPATIEEIDDDDFKIYRVRGFKGRVKASPKKVPRTLSASSISTRRRMEALIKRAREHWAKQDQNNKNKEKESAEVTVNNASSKPSNAVSGDNASETLVAVVLPAESASDVNSSIEEEDDDDDDFDGIADDDEGLLIPLENFWVCEKRPNDSRTAWLTFFWSPEGEQYSSLEEVEDFGRNNLPAPLKLEVFRRAWNKDPGKLPKAKPKGMSQVVDDIIAAEEEEEEEEEVEDLHDDIEEQLDSPVETTTRPMVQIHQ